MTDTNTRSDEPAEAPVKSGPIGHRPKVFAVFLRLGFTSFCGSVMHLRDGRCHAATEI